MELGLASSLSRSTSSAGVSSSAMGCPTCHIRGQLSVEGRFSVTVRVRVKVGQAIGDCKHCLLLTKVFMYHDGGLTCLRPVARFAFVHAQGHSHVPGVQLRPRSDTCLELWAAGSILILILILILISPLGLRMPVRKHGAWSKSTAHSRELTTAANNSKVYMSPLCSVSLPASSS